MIVTLTFLPMPESQADLRDRMQIDVASGAVGSRWVFKNGRWCRVPKIEFGVTQITVTDTDSNTTWHFTPQQIAELLGA